MPSPNAWLIKDHEPLDVAERTGFVQPGNAEAEGFYHFLQLAKESVENSQTPLLRRAVFGQKGMAASGNRGNFS